MHDVCLFQLLDCPEEDLKHILPKAPVRLLARLARAYPRTAGRPFMNLLSNCLSQPTLMFLKEEIALEATPTLPEIRQAEAELYKLMRDYAKTTPTATASPCSFSVLSARIP